MSLPKIKSFSIFCPKLIIFVFSFFVFSLSFSSQALAYVAPPETPPEKGGVLADFQKTVLEPEFNKESFDLQTFNGSLNSINFALFGCVLSEEECKQIGGQAGIIHLMGGAIASLYANPPVSGIQYFADLGKRLNIATPAYAQGPTFQTLSQNLLPIWRAVRNLAYALFVILFILIGFAIMFRVRLDPQTVITLQSAIPRVILSLILVTFSFAIVGLLVDLTFVITNLYEATLRSFLDVSLLKQLEVAAKNAVMFVLIPGIIGGIIGSIIAPGVGTLIGVAVGASLITTIVGLLFLFALFRIAFMMIMAFIGIILKTVFAPLILIFNTFPGRPLLSGWLLNVLSDISVFPTFYILFGIANWLIFSLPPFFLPISGAGIFGPLSQLASALAGVAIMLMLPNIVNVVKEAIQRGMPFGAPAGLGLLRGGIEAGYAGFQYVPGIERIIGKPGTKDQPPEIRRAIIDALIRVFGRGRP